MRQRSESGAVATEYALIATFIAVAIITAVLVLAGATRASYEDSCDKLGAAAGTGATCAP